MIDKRLLKEMPQAKVMVWKQVFMQWLGMLSNIGMVFLFANIFVEMFQDTLTLRNLMLCAIGVILMIIVRMLTSMQASRYSYRASCDVKNHLRQRIYEKLLELKNSYTQHIATSELVQLSVEGVDQLETYLAKLFGVVGMCTTNSTLYHRRTKVCEKAVIKILDELCQSWR